MNLEEFMPPLDAEQHGKVAGIYIYDANDDYDVLNLITHVMKLTRAKIEKQDDWSDWKKLEYLQIDQ